MYRNIEGLRGENESYDVTPQNRMDYIRSSLDIIFFAIQFYWITTLDHGLKLMDPREFQKKILKCIISPPNNKRHLILKIGRQSGKSTVVALYVLWYVLFNQHKRVAILANQEGGAKEMLDRIKFAYQRLPLWMQQGVREWNKKSIKLENGCEIIIGSTSGESITGKSINLLILDEFAKVPNHIANDFIRGAFPVISSGLTTQMIIISTPKGMNHYYDFWQRARDPESDFYRIEVPYWEVPGRDEAWRQKEIKTNGIVSFRQEYECEFLGSSSTLIEGNILGRIKPIEPSSLKWNGAFQIYQKPVTGCHYILGIDVGKGVGSDYSIIQVLKVNGPYQIEQVAVYSSNTVSPSKFATVIESVAQWYNEAWMLIETNDVGSVTATKLYEDLEYENMVIDDKNEYGVRANRGNKAKAHVHLKDFVENGYLKIVDADTINELSRYEEQRIGVFGASTGHDDRVTSLLWGCYIMLTPFWEDIIDSVGYDEDDDIDYYDFNNIFDPNELYGDDDDGEDFDFDDENVPLMIVNF